MRECILCKKQYAEKSETSFNIRLNNYRKDVKIPETNLTCSHFHERNHVFNKLAKLIIIDKLRATHKSKDILRQRLNQELSTQ